MYTDRHEHDRKIYRMPCIFQQKSFDFSVGFIQYSRCAIENSLDTGEYILCMWHLWKPRIQYKLILNQICGHLCLSDADNSHIIPIDTPLDI